MLVPAPVRAAIGRGLSYDASDRFASIDELIASLHEVDDRKPRRVVAPIAGAVLVAIGGVVAYAITRGSPAAQPPREPLAVAGSARAYADASAPLSIEPAIPDAAVAMIPMVVDAGMVADARVRVAHADARVAPDAAPPQVAEAPAGSGSRSIPISVPTTKHLPAAEVGNPAHLPVIRAAIRNLGYKGIDLSALAEVEKEATATIATAKGIDLGIAQVKLGMVERRRGDCKGAIKLWQDERLTATSPAPGPLWAARAAFGISLCELEANDADEAYHTVMKAFVYGDQDEVKLVMAYIEYERDEKDAAFARLLGAERSSDPQVRASLKLWLDGNGLTLR